VRCLKIIKIREKMHRFRWKTWREILGTDMISYNDNGGLWNRMWECELDLEVASVVSVAWLFWTLVIKFRDSEMTGNVTIWATTSLQEAIGSWIHSVTHEVCSAPKAHNKINKVKVKQSCYRPGVAQRVPGS